MLQKIQKSIDLIYECEVSAGIYEAKDDVLKFVSVSGGSLHANSFDTKNATNTQMIIENVKNIMLASQA